MVGTFDESSPFSFLMRTRQSNGFLALLMNRNTSSHLVVYLKDGKINFNTTISGTQQVFPLVQNDGLWHEIIISTKHVSDNGNQFTFGNPLMNFNVSQIYLGGVDPTKFSDSTVYSDVIFDGCLQAVKFKNTLLTSQPIPTHKTVNITMNGVNHGCPSNNPCSSSPCLYGGDCTDVWFAYNCSCQTGFSGKNCSLYGCDIFNQCPIKADCVDVPLKPGKTKCKYYSFLICCVVNCDWNVLL